MKPQKTMKIETNDGYYGPLMVCHSNAGYYIGRIFHHNDGYSEPGSRESNYYKTYEEAENAFETEEWEWRNSPENQFLYDEEKSANM